MRRIVGAILALALMFILVPATEASATSHWSSGVIYVENHAPGWPVRAVAESMDNGLTVNLMVVRKCPPHSRCIRVYGIRNIPAPYVGYTYLWWNGNYRTVSATIYLDNSWRRNASFRQRRSLICHELGHSLGLGHSRSPGSCMYPYAGRYRSSHLSRKDRIKLRRWY